MNFSKRVKELRLEAGYTQAKLGELLGVSESAIRKYESNLGKPKRKNLEKMAVLFDVSVSYLLGETDIRNHSSLQALNDFSKRIKMLRLEAGYTQQELADKIGMSASGYSSYGSGTRPTFPRTAQLEKIAAVLNVSVSYLLGETEDRPLINEKTLTTFPERLKFLRKKSGYKQKDLVKKLKLSSTQVYSNYERGVRQPSKETLERISEIFNVSVKYLLCETDERTPKNK